MTKLKRNWIKRFSVRESSVKERRVRNTVGLPIGQLEDLVEVTSGTNKKSYEKSRNVGINKMVE